MNDENRRKQILIVDSHPIMRQGVGNLIAAEADLEVCAETDSAGAALILIAGRKPDLVLSDLGLSDKSGLEFIKDVQALHPGTPVLVVSMYHESLYAERVLHAGARGYIMKHETGKSLMKAIRQVLAGGIYLSDRVYAQFLEKTCSAGRRASGRKPTVESLSDREFQVFQLVSEGRKPREIATRLHLSVKTVDVHRANIRKRLRLRSAAELTRYAARWANSRQAEV